MAEPRAIMAPKNKILALSGPNLNLLGVREPEVYGHATLKDIESLCLAKAGELGLALDFRQTNHEGVLVDWIQEALGTAQGIVINGAAYSHTSVAIHDALKTVALPVIEVHLTNIYKREDFRHHSYISPVAAGVICGLGPHGYVLALEALAKIIG
jgi:3-dehydroquinate dehydratase-2